MATLVTVTFNDKKEHWLARPNQADPSMLAMRGVLQESHFLGDGVDVEKFVAMVKEELAESDITVRVFKEQLVVPPGWFRQTGSVSRYGTLGRAVNAAASAKWFNATTPHYSAARLIGRTRRRPE